MLNDRGTLPQHLPHYPGNMSQLPRKHYKIGREASLRQLLPLGSDASSSAKILLIVCKMDAADNLKPSLLMDTTPLKQSTECVLPVLLTIHEKALQAVPGLMRLNTKLGSTIMTFIEESRYVATSTSYVKYGLVECPGMPVVYLRMPSYAPETSVKLSAHDWEQSAEVRHNVLKSEGEDNNEKHGDTDGMQNSSRASTGMTSDGLQENKRVSSSEPEQATEDGDEVPEETFPEEVEMWDTCCVEDVCGEKSSSSSIAEPLLSYGDRHVKLLEVIKKVLLQLTCLFLLLKHSLSPETLQKFVSRATYILLRDELLLQLLLPNHGTSPKNLQLVEIPVSSCGEEFDCCEELQISADKDEKESCDQMEYDKSLRGLHSLSHQSELAVYAAPLFQSNTDRLVPPSLHQRLSLMSPSVYHQHLMDILSEEQRELLMCHEIHRRKTFLVNWPHSRIANLAPDKMAQAGLYYVGNGDVTQCAFCRGRLHCWTADDVPMAEHARLFNFCRFVKGLSCGNIEYGLPDLHSSDLVNITQFANSNGTAQNFDVNLLGISTARPAFSQYASFIRRKSTFTHWPTNNPKTPDSLVEAGFYYTGNGDTVRCFFCSGALHEWVEGDDPWREHARWFPNCFFLIGVKGQDFIREISQQSTVNERFSLSEGSIVADSLRRPELDHPDQWKDFCLALGHDPRAIEYVTRRNGGSFADVKELIDALYRLEEEEVNLDALPPAPQRATVAENNTRDTSLVRERSRPALNEPPSDTSPSIGNCKICEVKVAAIVPATHVGLPCGHLIYCSTCHDDETRKCLAGGYTSKCPRQRCGATLNGTMRVHFS